MSLKVILGVNTPLRQCIRVQFSKRYFASSTSENVISSIPTDEKPIFEDEDDTQQDEMIEHKRNKSRLSTAHRNILYDKKPYEENVDWFHSTLKYKRKMFGRYGMASGVNPAIVWPTVEELEDMKEYERVAYPVELKDAWAQIEEKHRIEAEKIRAREAEISEKILKLDKWKGELQKKLDKKREALEAAKAHKEKLMEEIRQQFGFKIDVHDVRFKEMLEKKEKEAKKMKKEERKKFKEERLRQKLEELHAKQLSSNTTENKSSKAASSDAKEATETDVK